MAETQKTSRPRAPRKSAAERKKLEEAAKAAESAPAEEGFSAPAVIVYRDTNPDGSQTVRVAAINGLDPLAVPSLLEYGIKVHRQNIGLTDD